MDTQRFETEAGVELRQAELRLELWGRLPGFWIGFLFGFLIGAFLVWVL